MGDDAKPVLERILATIDREIRCAVEAGDERVRQVLQALRDKVSLEGR